MSIVVLGANSLIASALRACASTAGWRFLGHVESKASDDWLRGARVVLNCAFDPRLRDAPYDSRHDFDLHVAARLREHSDAHYVMLSSRLVYGPTEDDPCLVETREPRPARPYSVAKRATEIALRDALGDRLTILRLSNVFGAEYQPGRLNFVATALRTLRELDRITLDISPFVERDFIPVEELAESLIRIANSPRSGLFNLGAGAGTPVGRIAQWLIEGYGRGRLVVTSPREIDGFWLDMSACRGAFDLEPLPAQRVRDRCRALGRMLNSLPVATT